MQNEIERVLALQGDWDSKNTSEMKNRGLLIRTTIPGFLSGALERFLKGMPDHFQDFAIEGRDGTGLKSEIPWIRAYSKSRSPNATQGWYLVYLFDGFGRGVHLSINQGTTRWDAGEFKPRPREELLERAAWARSILQEDTHVRPDLVADITLETRKSFLGKAYEAGNVFALTYGPGAVPSDDILFADFEFMSTLLSLLYEDTENQLVVPGEPAPEVTDALILADTAAGRSPRGGRNRLTSAERKAIEMRAVQVATDHLTSQGYRVKDVGETHSYDLDARRGSTKLFVEVKGTVTDGELVILTRNEVALHRAEYPLNMLALVTRIVLDRSGMAPIATGGDLRTISPWGVDLDRLTPLSFSYEVPR